MGDTPFDGEALDLATRAPLVDELSEFTPGASRRGVLVIGEEELRDLFGVRSSENIESVHWEPALREVRVYITGRWLPMTARGAEPPVVDDRH